MALLFAMVPLAFIISAIRECVLPECMPVVHVQKSHVLLTIWLDAGTKTVSVIILPLTIVYSTIKQNPSASAIEHSSHKVAFVEVLLGDQFYTASIGSALLIYFAHITASVFIVFAFYCAWDVIGVGKWFKAVRS